MTQSTPLRSAVIADVAASVEVTGIDITGMAGDRRGNMS
jgi:hypothetical protein